MIETNSLTLGFKEFFLVEGKKKSLAKTAETASDDKGKLHELLLGKHLHPKNVLPAHWRSKSEDYGGTPEQVHERLGKKIGEDAYHEINSHAKQTADSIKSHIEQHFPGHKITDVHWTSNRDAEHNPGDHEKTTGIKDRNSNADLIVSLHHPKSGHKTFLGVSAKYGSSKNANFKNSGLNTLEQEAKVGKGTYTGIMKQHEERVKALGYSGNKKQNHAQYKVDIASKPSTKAYKRASAAVDSALKARSKMASIHRTALSTKSDAELRDIVKGNVSPITHFPHVVAQSRVNSDGSAASHVHAAHSMADEHLNKFENLHVKPNGSGIRVTIHGTHKSGPKKGQIGVVASQSFKGSSGPMKGVAGAFKLA